VDAGAKTKMSSVPGLPLLVCVAFIPHLLNLIPAALAAILISQDKVAKPSCLSVTSHGWQQFLPFSVTVLAICSQIYRPA
jgi:hypothetical protein